MQNGRITHFGDVMTFDTTFATNKEHRPFGVFVGFNHFRKTVIDTSILHHYFVS
jgi:hypothetical protein